MKKVVAVVEGGKEKPGSEKESHVTNENHPDHCFLRQATKSNTTSRFKKQPKCLEHISPSKLLKWPVDI